MATTSGIYEIRNKVTGVSYIGSSINTEVRKRQHIYALRKGKHPARYMQNAWNKHGEDAFEFLILEEVPDVLRLIEREQHWIDTKKPRYNSREVAESNRGLKQSPEVIQAKRERQTGVARPPQVKAKIREALAGRPATEGALKGLRKGWDTTGEKKATMKGKTTSSETRQKQAEAATDRKPTPESIEKMRAAKAGKKQKPEHIQARSQGMMGHEISQETRDQIAESNRATWATKSEEEKHRIATSRPPVTDEARQHLRESHLGIEQSPELVNKRIDAAYRNKSPEEQEAIRAKRKATWEAKRQSGTAARKPKV